MKTVKNKNGEIKRMNDREAQKLVSQKHLGWSYCPKSEFKSQRK